MKKGIQILQTFWSVKNCRVLCIEIEKTDLNNYSATESFIQQVIICPNIYANIIGIFLKQGTKSLNCKCYPTFSLLAHIYKSEELLSFTS